MTPLQVATVAETAQRGSNCRERWKQFFLQHVFCQLRAEISKHWYYQGQRGRDKSRREPLNSCSIWIPVQSNFDLHWFHSAWKLCSPPEPIYSFAIYSLQCSSVYFYCSAICKILQNFLELQFFVSIRKGSLENKRSKLGAGVVKGWKKLRQYPLLLRLL